MGTNEVKEPLYVCVYVPEFPAQALMRLRPELQRVPVAVLAGNPPWELVCSLNAQAGRLGVAHGMTRAELDCFPALTILLRSEEEERIAHAALLEAAGFFTPRVEVQPHPVSTFVMVLDMTGTRRMFGASPKAVGGMSRMLNSLHFHVQLAASANLHTAVCLAPSARREPVFVPKGEEQAALAKLPLAVLNLTPQQADMFTLWGLRALGELAELPETDLVVRLGQPGKRLRQMARGELPHLMVPVEPTFALEEFLAFEEPVELLDSLLYVLGIMLDQLLTRAQSRSYALASLAVKLSLDGGGEHERRLNPAIPVVQQEVLLKLLQLDLQAHPPPAGVVSVFVHAEPGDRTKVQLGLFAPQMPEALRLDVTIARIAALVGEGRVGKARLADTHRSDSFTMERFTVPTNCAGTPAEAKHPVALRRYRPPLLLSVQHKGTRFDAFMLHGKRYSVREAYGPWRKSGEWWSADVWSLEEWDIRADAGVEDTLLCLVSHDLLHHRWQLEALYD